MNQYEKWVKITVCFAAGWGIYSFLSASQLLSSPVESATVGNLGSPAASALGGLLEIVAAIGGVVLLIASKLIEAVTPIIGGLFGFDESSDPVATNAPTRVEADSLETLLVSAAKNGEPQLLAVMANKLHGSTFIDVPAMEKIDTPEQEQL